MYKGEWFNSITHLIGAVFSLIGLILLVFLAINQGDFWKIVSFSIYGTTLVLLYTFSSLYHSLQGKLKEIFCQLDHLSIYLLIAGTYTPFTLITLRGHWGWSIFAVIWGLAILGIVTDFFFKRGRRVRRVIIYLFMGWLILIVLKPLLASLPLTGFIYLLIGGMLYTVGVIFYSLDEKIPHSHGIWHLFVLAGSLCHYLTIYFYLS